MSVPPTPETPGETPPAGGASTSGAQSNPDHTAADLPTQPALPAAQPRTTGTPPTQAPRPQTYPPQQATPTTPQQTYTHPPTPQRAYTQPPTPQQTTPPTPQRVYTQPPAPVPTYPPTNITLSSSPESPLLESLMLKNNQRPKWISIGIAAVLLLALLGVGGFGLYATHEAQQSTVVAQTFCHDLQTKQYAAAYQMLSSTYQAKTTQAQFVEEADLHDQVDGPVAACAATSSSAPKGYTLRLIDSATLAVHISRHKPLDGSITLIRNGNGWKVNGIAPALQGTDLAPLFVGMTFCKALVAKDYPSVYNTFSTHERSGGTEADFAATFTKAFGTNMEIAKCIPAPTSYAVAPNAASATVDVALQITLHVQGNGQVTIPATLTFVREHGAWKVDSIAIKSA